MKTAAKVFLIIGMVLGALGIFPIIFGVLALKRLEDPTTTKEDNLVWSILAMVFCSLLGGLFMLLSYDEEHKPVVEAKVVEEPKEEE